MKRTVYIPDDLDERFEEYLREHPEETLSSVVREAIQKKLVRKDVSELLALSGIAQETTCNARDRAEDYYAGLEKPWKQLVLDADPLIALFFTKDVDHVTREAGFEQLKRTRTILLTPMPIVFEVASRVLSSVNLLIHR